MRYIPGFNKKYKISKSGKIYSLYINAYLKLQTHGGYYKISLRYNDEAKTCSVHRLVALTYIPNPHNYEIVNHKDGNKKNNHVSNLEWCTKRQNSVHAWKNGLAKPRRCKAVDQIDEKGNIIKSFSSGEEAARQLGVHASSITRICNGWTEKVKGLRFKYSCVEKWTPTDRKPPLKFKKVQQIDPVTKKIVQTFKNQATAGRALGVNCIPIGQACLARERSGEERIYKKFMWSFAPIEKLAPDPILEKIKNWKPDPKHLDYLVSRNGQIYSKKCKRILKPWKANGYLKVNMDKKDTLVHRAVARAYIPRPKECRCVNHKNGKRDDPRVENLEWCTQSENCRHAIDTNLRKKGKQPVEQYTLTGKLIAAFPTRASAARHIGCSEGHIRDSAKYGVIVKKKYRFKDIS